MAEKNKKQEKRPLSEFLYGAAMLVLVIGALALVADGLEGLSD